jgi:MBG domain (YGX type)
VNAVLKVTKAPLTITAEDKTWPVGQPNPVLTASYNGFVNGDSEASLDIPVTLSTTAKATSPAGSYAIKATAAKGANYSITFVNGTLIVMP